MFNGTVISKTLGMFGTLLVIYGIFFFPFDPFDTEITETPLIECAPGEDKKLKFLKCDGVYTETLQNRIDAKDKPNCVVKPSDNLSISDIKTQPHCENVRERRTFSDTALWEKQSDLAERVALIRDRVRDLESGSRRTKEWARYRLNISNLVMIFLGLFYVFFAAGKPKEPDEAAATSANGGAPTLLSLVGVQNLIKTYFTQPMLLIVIFAAVMNSSSYHSKYAAAFEAQNRYAGLNIRIENQTLNFAKSFVEPDNIKPEEWKKVSAAVKEWSTEAAKIMGDYGKAFGASAGILSLTDLGK